MPPEPITEDRIREALTTVVDPEAGVNVVELGLAYGNRRSAGQSGDTRLFERQPGRHGFTRKP